VGHIAVGVDLDFVNAAVTAATTIAVSSKNDDPAMDGALSLPVLPPPPPPPPPELLPVANAEIP